MDTYSIKRDNYGASLQSLQYDPKKDPDSPEYTGPTTVKFLTCANENIESTDHENGNCTRWFDMFQIPGICVSNIVPIDVMLFSDHKSNNVIDIHSIRFVNFKSLKDFNSFPKYDDNRRCKQNICVDYLSIKRQHSLFIYISHTWLVNSDGSFQPDNIKNEKFQLIMSVVEKIKSTHARGFSNCYIWFDYCCQDTETASEYKILDRVIEACDIILTPIIDDDHDKWKLTDTSTAGCLHDYNASSWNGTNQHAYLNRSINRMELLLSVAIPLYPDTEVIFNLRKSKTRGALLQAMTAMRRCHFIFGTKEQMNNKEPYLLPALHTKLTELVELYDPRKGYLYNDNDNLLIKELYEKLETYIFLKEQKNGREKIKIGTETIISDDGTIYKGIFKNGLIQKGKIYLPNGDTYDGKFKNAKFHDKKGKFIWNKGDCYVGGFVDGKRKGSGIFTRAIDGYSEEGVWADDELSNEQLEKCKIM